MPSFLDRVDAHLNHRLSLKTFFKEVYAHFADRVLPQGCDEVANALFSGRAYLPWPGPSGPKPIAAPPPGPSELEATQPNSFDVHAALYGVSYSDQLDQAAGLGRDNDRGIGR